MIIEELVGALISLGSLLITQTPPISRNSPQRTQYWLIFDEPPEDDKNAQAGLVHREYERATQERVPYYDDTEVSTLLNENQTSRSVSQSLRRSFEVNFGLLIAVFLLGLMTITLVFIDLNTTNSCIEWKHFNHSVPSNVKVLQIIGTCVTAIPLFIWFPVSAAMLWGWKEFKQNYSACVFVSLFTATIAMVYRAALFDKYSTLTEYRLPDHVLFLLTMFVSVYLAARKFKDVNEVSNYSLSHIIFCLSFTFIAASVLAYIYTYVIVKYFTETKGKVKKAIIAALTPGIILLPTAIAKYFLIRKTSKMVADDKTFVLCYFLRGGAIGLYRTMQSDFQNMWLFIGLSLLHGVSNVLSKTTLNLRIRMWKFFIGCANKTRCGSKLEVLPSDTPRIRRLNADLEIQNIVFEYTTVVLSQAYLVLYLVMNFEVMDDWQIIQEAMTRISISTGIDFVFNIITVFVQIHCYNIPMRRVWSRYWRRHVIANVFIMICTVSYFGTPLVGVFEAREDRLNRFELKNCTSWL